jgi:broad specificity phosphatase PhoE
LTGRLAAVTHAAVIKAMVVHALGVPVDAVWHMDVPRASVTELPATSTGWP